MDPMEGRNALEELSKWAEAHLKEVRKVNENNDAWRCQHCNALQYFKDENGYPCEGAPAPLYYDVIWTKLCRLCFQIATNDGLSSAYWRELHMKYLETEYKRKENKKRLSGENDYFTGV
jgi:hypothetical protein